MSNKIGEWIDNKTHPLQELEEARYFRNDPDGGVDYEEILVKFRYVDDDDEVLITLGGQYFTAGGFFVDWSAKYSMVIATNCWDFYENKSEPELLGDIEIIAYMLIPECEVGNGDK